MFEPRTDSPFQYFLDLWWMVVTLHMLLYPFAWFCRLGHWLDFIGGGKTK